MKEFMKVAVGGTFDKLHRGHKTLILKAFEIGEKVVIGLSSDEFVLRMGKPHKTASYTHRRNELETFLAERGLSDRAEIVSLNNSYGLTLSCAGLEALVVSEETTKTAESINLKRQKTGLIPFKIVTVAMVPAENHNPISTTRIRRGEMDRNGNLLKQARIC